MNNYILHIEKKKKTYIIKFDSFQYKCFITHRKIKPLLYAVNAKLYYFPNLSIKFHSNSCQTDNCKLYQESSGFCQGIECKLILQLQWLGRLYLMYMYKVVKLINLKNDKMKKSFLQRFLIMPFSI